VEIDDDEVTVVYDDFLSALRIVKGKKRGIKSPVSVAKALHVLASRFFPIWDRRIAAASDCRYAAVMVHA